jgi:hypothetical protein
MRALTAPVDVDSSTAATFFASPGSKSSKISIFRNLQALLAQFPQIPRASDHFCSAGSAMAGSWSSRLLSFLTFLEKEISAPLLWLRLLSKVHCLFLSASGIVVCRHSLKPLAICNRSTQPLLFPDLPANSPLQYQTPGSSEPEASNCHFLARTTSQDILLGQQKAAWTDYPLFPAQEFEHALDEDDESQHQKEISRVEG